ncbi:MAG: TolC family protein [Chitinophagaceae bacterium]
MNFKKFSLAAVIIVFIFSASFNAAAQLPGLDSLLKKALITDRLLPILIDSAVRFSPDMRRTRGNQNYAQANAHISKNAILNAFNLQSSYMYGTNYTAISDKSVAINNNNLTTAQTGFYNVGVGFQLPISSIINRKYIIKSGQSQIDMAKAETANLELLIKQEVIRLYHEFKLAHKMMLLGNINRQTTQINKSMAEKDFTNGQLTIDKLSIVLESYNKSLLEYETYLNRFQETYMQLEAFTGTNLSGLIINSR